MSKLMKKYRMVPYDPERPLDSGKRYLEMILGDNELDDSEKCRFYQDLLFRLKFHKNLPIMTPEIMSILTSSAPGKPTSPPTDGAPPPSDSASDGKPPFDYPPEDDLWWDDDMDNGREPAVEPKEEYPDLKTEGGPLRHISISSRHKPYKRPLKHPKSELIDLLKELIADPIKAEENFKNVEKFEESFENVVKNEDSSKNKKSKIPKITPKIIKKQPIKIDPKEKPKHELPPPHDLPYPANIPTSNKDDKSKIPKIAPKIIKKEAANPLKNIKKEAVKPLKNIKKEPAETVHIVKPVVPRTRKNVVWYDDGDELDKRPVKKAKYDFSDKESQTSRKKGVKKEEPDDFEYNRAMGYGRRRTQRGVGAAAGSRIYCRLWKM